ncbi:MAG TPA: hypothetical protein PKD88_08285 [Nitrosomonas sp.]|nr:hypothetical protein [Nitrosomonas sp.]HMW20992.1 hypothetical protein [Nitrosomonas sp.]HMW69898.1 hypothetical protein [Nitrosomonas sp.]HMY62178.1 hypothetical protein [Nitrosomonas sp.]HMY91348.1 hypothetical protein [Nitrosomonas sp.]
MPTYTPRGINAGIEINESSGLDKEISLIPIMSGYRDKDTFEVSLTTYYEAIDTDLDIVIRQDKILTASWFDFDVYKKLNHKKRQYNTSYIYVND